jgi:cytochrome c-type biogenesis protein CcmH/NrfG
MLQMQFVEHTQVRINLGRAFERLNRVSEAIEQYTCAVRIKPDFVRAILALKRLGVEER